MSLPPLLRSRIVPHIAFIRPIPVLGSSLRVDQFSATDGWVIEVHDYGVTISRPANPPQNILETPAFCTCGVGYSVPEPVTEPAAAVVEPVEPVVPAPAESAQRPIPYYERKGKR